MNHPIIYLIGQIAAGDAYIMGRRAANRGQINTNNPFTESKYYAEAWGQGYRDQLYHNVHTNKLMEHR